MQQQDGQLDELAQQDPTQRAQETMLRMGQQMREQGHVNEAAQMYLQLMRDYPDTQASRAAANALIDLAQYLEQNGMPHTALELYRKLEDLQ